MTYIYLGDRLTRPDLKGAKCRAVKNENGKCKRSPMGTMEVEFENEEKHIVLGRRLKKIPI